MPWHLYEWKGKATVAPNPIQVSNLNRKANGVVKEEMCVCVNRRDVWPR